MEKVYMVCLGFEPYTAGWKAQTNPLTTPLPPKNKFVVECIADVARHRQVH